MSDSTGKGATLVAVLANPAMTDGSRTGRRVQLLGTTLGFDRVLSVNLFPLPTRSTPDIARIGREALAWMAGRAALSLSLDEGDQVLLAHGVTEPIGPARSHYRDQVAWVHDQIVARGLPACQVGDGPRHPSRWQRWTSRTYPDLPFAEALRLSVVRTVIADRGGP